MSGLSGDHVIGLTRIITAAVSAAAPATSTALHPSIERSPALRDGRRGRSGTDHWFKAINSGRQISQPQNRGEHQRHRRHLVVQQPPSGVRLKVAKLWSHSSHCASWRTPWHKPELELRLQRQLNEAILGHRLAHLNQLQDLRRRLRARHPPTTWKLTPQPCHHPPNAQER